MIANELLKNVGKKIPLPWPKITYNVVYIESPILYKQMAVIGVLSPKETTVFI